MAHHLCLLVHELGEGALTQKFGEVDVWFEGGPVNVKRVSAG